MYITSNILLENIFDYKDLNDLFDFKSGKDIIEKFDLYFSLLRKINVIKELDLNYIFKDISELYDIDSQTLEDMQITKTFIEDTIKKSRTKGLDVLSIMKNVNPFVNKLADRIVNKIKKNEIDDIGKLVSDSTTDFKKIIIDVISKADPSNIQLGTMLSILITILSICIILVFTSIFKNIGIKKETSSLIAISLGSLFTVILINEKSRIFTVKKGFQNDFKFSVDSKILGDIISNKLWIIRIDNTLSSFSDVFDNITQKQLRNIFIDVFIQIVANIPKSSVIGGDIMGDHPVFINTPNIVKSLEDPNLSGEFQYD